jgi:hypothetical protein
MVGAFHLDLQAVGKPLFPDGGDEEPASLFTLVAVSRAHRTTSQAVRDFPPVVS